MTINTEHRRFQSGLALVLCFFLLFSSANGFSDTQQGATTDVVGKVTAVRSTVTRNGVGLRQNDVIHANDILKTDDSGRVSVELQDGSVLSIGSDTELRIVNHDPPTGTTLVNLSSGQLRCRIPKLRSSGKFVIETPYGTVSALGTDFFLDVNDRNRNTELILYSGVLLVTSSALTDLDRKLVLDVAAGQNVLMDDKGIRYLQLTPKSLEEQTIAETTVPELTAPPVAAAEPIARKSSHTLRNVTIGALAAGAGIGAAIGLRGSKSPASNSNPTASVPPTIPAH